MLDREPPEGCQGLASVGGHVRSNSDSVGNASAHIAAATAGARPHSTAVPNYGWHFAQHGPLQSQAQSGVSSYGSMPQWCCV